MNWNTLYQDKIQVNIRVQYIQINWLYKVFNKSLNMKN